MLLAEESLLWRSSFRRLRFRPRNCFRALSKPIHILAEVHYK